MKLLCISPGYWPAFQYGGPIVSVHNLNKTLIKAGIDVTVYATNAGLNGTVQVNREVTVDGLKVIYFDFLKYFEFVGSTGWQLSLSLNNALKKNLKSFDLVHIHAVWNYPSGAAAHYCRKYDKPYMITPRGMLYPYTLGKMGWKKLPYFKLITKRDLRSASAIHYTTEDELEKCHSYLGLRNKAVVVPNGIDISEFTSLPSPDILKARYPALSNKKVILFLGRISWKKGLDVLVKAFASVKKRRDDVHLLIAGNDEGGYVKKVRKWLKDEGISKDATFTGLLEGSAKLEAFAGSDLFVLPSYSENFGMAVIEAMACGLPVIISDQVGIYREVINAEAGVVISPDATELAKALANMLDDPDNNIKFKENSRKLVSERFTWDKISGQMMQIYESMIRSKAS
ncbi:MAG: glycosyltransferase [Nitrospiraceae bacterium]|nr:MAG: glycosyltransferase [Nitrospiraceae bacterium]